MPADDITFINAALTRSGNEVITSLDDDNARARLMRANYEVIVLAELGKYDWKWAKKFEALAQLEDAPPDPWQFAYQLPADLRTLRTVKQSGATVAYAVMGRKLFADVDNSEADVVAEFSWRPPESDWPPWFAEPLTKRLEAVALRAFGERHTEAAERDKEAKDEFAVARRLDAQSQSARDPFNYPMLAARRA